MQPGESTERLQSNTARLCKERELSRRDGEKSQLRDQQEREAERADREQGGGDGRMQAHIQTGK